MKHYLKLVDLVTSPKRRGRYPFSKATLLRLIAAERFPAPVRLGNTAAWSIDVLEAWEATQTNNLPRDTTKQAAAAILSVSARKARSIHGGA